MKLTKKIQKAINLASRLHSGQVRKGDDNLPYISHPYSVAWILSLHQ
jgi:(p)ppGpp synthase/HD superfamily hydrolase